MDAPTMKEMEKDPPGDEVELAMVTLAMDSMAVVAPGTDAPAMKAMVVKAMILVALGGGEDAALAMDAATCEQPPGLHRRLAPRERSHRRHVPSRWQTNAMGLHCDWKGPDAAPGGGGGGWRMI